MLAGPSAPTTVTDDNSVGTVAWTNPGNLVNNAGSATDALTNAAVSHYLDLTGFGFSVPSNATITGVGAGITRKSGAGSVADSRVRLIINGAVQSAADRAILGAAWPTSATAQAYGGSADLWGQGSLTPSQVNAGNFGVALAATGTGTDTATVSGVTLSVYYTLPKDLITLNRAYLNLAGVSADATVGALVTAVSEAVEKFCRRRFVSTSYDELYDGTGDRRLLLRQYPVQSVKSVRYRPVTVLKVINNNTFQNQQARVAITSTGLQCSRVASGVTTNETLLTWATYPTLQGLASAVTALGNGWQGQIVGDSTLTGDYGLWPSADLYVPSSYGDPLEGAGVLQSQGALTARGQFAELKMHTYELAGYQWDARGWLLRAIPYTDPELLHPEDLVWPTGVNNFRVQYTAGYTTIPEAVQEACARWVARAYYLSTRDPALTTQIIAGATTQKWGLAPVLDHEPPEEVRALLAPYRRHTVATDQG
jgi:hypothetical protein